MAAPHSAAVASCLPVRCSRYFYADFGGYCRRSPADLRSPADTLPPAVNPPFEFSGNFCAIASRFRALGSVGIYPAPAPAGAAGCSPSLMCACACVWSHFRHISAMFLPLLIAAAPLCRLVLRHHAPPQEKRAFSFALCKRLSVLFRLLPLRLSMVSARLPLTLVAGVRGFRRISAYFC